VAIGSLEEILAKYGLGSTAQGLAGTLMTAVQAQQGGGGGGRRNAGMRGEQASGGGTPRQTILEIARKAEKKGFNVGGLEGWRGMGPISSGHVSNSQHYSGLAADITGGSGRRDLNWLEHFLHRKYGPQLTELFYGGNNFLPSSVDPSHMGHLHVGTRPGG
jgi:hypothetical protein